MITMGYKPIYTVTALLRKIEQCMDLSNEPSKTLTFELFKKIMMDEETIQPVISNSRTVKEKYRDLQDLGYITKSSVPRLDVNKLYNKLAAMEGKEWA